jgi:hypothetical protein
VPVYAAQQANLASPGVAAPAQIAQPVVVKDVGKEKDDEKKFHDDVRLVVEQQRIDHMAQLHREGIHNIGVLVVFLSDAHLQNALYKDPADRSVFVRGLVVNSGQLAPVLNPVKSASDCVAQLTCSTSCRSKVAALTSACWR